MKKNNSIIRTRSQKIRKEEEQFGKLIFKLEWLDYLQNDFNEEEETPKTKKVSLIDDWDTDEQVFDKAFSVEELKAGKQIVKKTETNDNFKRLVDTLEPNKKEKVQ
jgi:hypothetical protein